jgi:hypothetical protein
MPIKIEQITKTGLVVEDYDAKISIAEIKQILSNQRYLKVNSNNNPYSTKYKDKDITLCVKSISYLGIPHLHYKKRIQIPKEWKNILQQENTLLLGVYSYNNEITFCLFDTKKYKNNKLNNSSAHIHTMDIHKAREDGIFNKTDNKGNEITVFTEQNFTKIFDIVLLNKEPALPNEISIFSDFSNTLKLNWNGVECYTEMMNANFNNAYQGEWAGFYLEYKFDEFLKNTIDYQDVCQYKQNKKRDSIDLDLWFIKDKYYGDLKAHNLNQNLLGNDKINIYKAIEKYQKVWYIAFSHKTIKDKDNKGVTTQFWNQKLNNNKGKNKKLDSYLSKMKHSIILDNFAILEINKFNQQYLVDFKQGKNSNGTPRNVKISIKNKDINNDNFAIYRQKL